MRSLLAVVTMITLTSAAAPAAAPATSGMQAADSTAYLALFLRAAPGRLLDLVELYRQRMAVQDAAKEPRPLFARHSQGDQWDLLLLYPIGSLSAYHAPEHLARWRQAAVSLGYDEAAFERRAEDLVAWREELFVAGPPVDTLRARNADAGFYHLEVFLALAGQRAGLLRQRRMENDYLQRIGRADNLVFTRLGGGPWDLFTLGFYRNLQHYAEPSTLSEAADDAAARAAGFESRLTIGSDLRTFLAGHHDTLLNRVR